MPRTTSCRRGDVVLVRFPFTDLRSTKQRPAIVLSSDAYNRRGDDVIVAAISGHRGDRPRPFDHPVHNWTGAGLLGPSVVRAGEIVTLDRSLVQRNLGTMASADLAAVDRLLRAALGLG